MFNLKVDIQRKYVFAVLGVLLLFAVIYRFLPFFQGLLFPTQEIEMKEMRLTKYRKVVESGKDMDKRPASVTETLKQLEARLLTGKTASLAAVEIQKVLQEIADKSQIQIRSVKVLNPVELDKKKYLSMPVEFYVLPTIRQLKEVLYRIETSSKYLTVRKLSTQFYGNSEGRSRCHITIAGFMKKGEN